MRRRAIKTKEYIDTKTGEIQRFLIVDIQEKDKEFAKVRKALTEAVMQDLRYLNGAVKLLFWIIDKAIENGVFNKPAEITIIPEKVAEEFNTSKRTIERHIALLLQKKYIIQPYPRRRIYIVNPHFLWIGDAKSYVQWVKENSQLKLFDRNDKKEGKNAKAK